MEDIPCIFIERLDGSHSLFSIKDFQTRLSVKGELHDLISYMKEIYPGLKIKKMKAVEYDN
jgi:hypothetical protein